MKNVAQRVKCIGGEYHRVLVGVDGLEFPDHPDVWKNAKALENLMRLGAPIPTDQIKTGCIALTAYAKLGKDVPTPKIGTRIVDIMNKRAAVRARLLKAAEPDEPSEKLHKQLRDVVLRTLKRCKYKHQVNQTSVNVGGIVPITAADMFKYWSILQGRKWVSTYVDEDWDLVVQIGWLSHVLSPGHAVVDRHFIAAINPADSSRVMAAYECTSKDPWDGVYLREAHIESGRLIWK